MGKYLTTKQWVEKAQLKHKGKYGYQMANYIDSKTPLQINCTTHGLFYQIPANHLTGQGCPECGKETGASKHKNSTEQFIVKGNIVHSNKYDYTKVVYEKSNVKVQIICKIHGDFLQTPNNHLKGSGCPKC